MISIGVIGVGANWETRYLPALRKLARRIHISAVYDTVANRAELVASTLQAVPVIGARALCDRQDVQALLLLDANWQQAALLDLIFTTRKPVYVAQCLFGEDIERLQSYHEIAIEDGVTWMPELGRRYTPSTSRLKELIVTRLGRPLYVGIDAIRPVGREHSGTDSETIQGLLGGWLDWCKYVVAAAPIRIASQPLDSSMPRTEVRGDRASRSIRIEFGTPPDAQDHSMNNTTPIVAEIRVRDRAWATNNLSDENRLQTNRLEVRCLRGTAVIDSARKISWKTSGESRTECLTEERSEVEVMLDHFCRRVVGGLIPVADVNDVCRSLYLVRAADKSFRQGRSVSLDGFDKV